MAPSNPAASDGKSGEYNRLRSSRTRPSNAIAAAEAAASYILSDGPIIGKKSLVRNRSSSAANANSGNSGNGGNGGNANDGVNNGSEGGSSSTTSTGMRGQREAALIRRRRKEKLVVSAWAFVFCLLGATFVYVGEQQLRRHEARFDIERRATATGDGKNGPAARLGVPSPPDVERNFLKARFVAKFVRGGRREDRGDGAPTESMTAPKVISTEEDAPASHHHSIPPVLVFTYHTDLIATPASDLADEEDAALAGNVRRIVALHPGSSVRFLDDDDCLDSIRAALGPDTNLAAHFAREGRGMYKADICRGAALYETGGLYFDVDIEARVSLWDVLAPRTEFVTTLVHEDSNHRGGFFQAFIGATARHAMFKRYLELFVLYYEGELKVDGPLGVYLLRMAYDAVNHDAETMELWQEVRYSPEAFPDVTRDNWFSRRACQMLVVAPPKESRKGEFQFERKRMVPFFSHSTGSRMCGGKDTNKKG